MQLSRKIPSAHGGFAGRLHALLAGAAIGLLGLTGSAAAQDGGIMGPGSAVVTGFSGFVTNEAPEGENPFDYVTINTNGPSAVVVDLTSVGGQGELSPALKTFMVPSAQTGQVFGVAVDNAPQPNIYLAATSAYGLSIYLPDGTETIHRIRTGTVGAQFVPGQFGPPEFGGNPGSVWRVDGATGEVVLFAQIDAAAQGVAALGGLAFDPATQQIFVADRTSGIIHRFTLDGVEQGTYDHGVEGRPPAGLSPLPYTPGAPVDIGAPTFDTENPATWGFAPPARRVFGLAVRNGRLYYSVAQGPQVWSVGIAPSGAVGGNPRLEVEVPSLQDGMEIASITFDGEGRMYLAERGSTTGDFELTDLAYGGASRVLRYLPKPPGAPNPGNWSLDPEQYAIGMPAPYNNANGGVALGYGYQPDGSMNPGACQETVWSTGERLLDPGDPSAPPESYPALDGIQGNALPLVEPDNMPPSAAWYIDYDDQPGSPEYRGYMGAIAIYSPCAGEGGYAPPPPPPPPPPTISCPPGTSYIDGQCVVTVVCPPGTSYNPNNNTCVYDACPPGYVKYKGQCVPPPMSCPPGFAFYDGKCIPLNCPPGMKRMPNGQCICPVNNLYYNGKCIPPQACPPGMVKYPNGVCWCPAGTTMQNGVCVPNIVWCPPSYIQINGKCVPPKCPPGYVKNFNGFCVPIIVTCPPLQILVNGVCVPKICPPYLVLGPNGKCQPIFLPCKQNEVNINGKCVPKKCPPLQFLGQDGKCHPKFIIDCSPGYKLVNGQCIPTGKPLCPPNQVFKNGACIKIPPAFCGPNQVFLNGKCVPKLPGPPPPKCGPNQIFLNGQCVLKPIGPIVCGPNQVLINGKCVLKPIGPIVCGPNQVLLNGKCVLKPIGPIVCGPNQVLINGQCVLKPIGPIVCGPKQVLLNGKCVLKPVLSVPPTCGPNQVLINGQCVLKLKPAPVIKCGPNQALVNGQCVQKAPPPPKCGPKQMLQNGQCVPKPTTNNDGATCQPGFAVFPKSGKCMPICGPNQVQNPNTGQCKAANNNNNNNNNNNKNKNNNKNNNNNANRNADGATCQPGFAVFAKTGKCMPICKNGQVQNPNTGQCKKPKNSSLDIGVPALGPVALMTPASPEAMARLN